MNAPVVLLLVGLVTMLVGETWGVIRKGPGSDTITDFVRIVVRSSWLGALVVAGGLAWALVHFLQ